MKKNSKRTTLTILAVTALACVGFSTATIKTASAETEEIFMVRGASVRLADDFYGLRFKMAVTPAYYEAHNQGNYGMIIIPNDYLTTYATELEQNGNDYVKAFSAVEDLPLLNFTDMDGYAADAEYKETAVEAKVEYQCFNGVISAIKYANLDRDFVGIGYYYDGTTYDYASFNATDNVRNVVQVANSAMEANATSETDLYTTKEMLRLYEYSFLSEQKAASVAEADAKAAYAEFKAEMPTRKKITNTGTKATVAQHEAVTLDTDDTLTVQFTLLESTLAFTGDFGSGFAVGAKANLDLDNYLVNNNILGAIRYAGSDVVMNGNKPAYTTRVANSDPTNYPNQKCGYTLSYSASLPTILTAGNSVKMVYEAEDSTTGEGSWDVYYKTSGATEWTLGLSVTGINGEVPKNNIVMGIYMWGNGKSVTVSDYSALYYDASADETGEKANTLGGTYVNVEECKGNVVTVQVDGEVVETAFVPFGKAYTPDESYGVTEWKLDGVAYDTTAPVFTAITLDGEAPAEPEPTLFESYTLSFNTTGGEVYFSNLKALEKGKHFFLEITVNSITYDSTDTGFFGVVGDDEEVKYANTVGVSGQHIIIQNNTGLNSGLSTAFTAGNKIIVKLVYKADSDQYFLRIYKQDESGLIWIRDTTPISYQELFGVVFVNYGLNCNFTVKCYDSDGTNLGVSASSNVTLTGNS